MAETYDARLGIALGGGGMKGWAHVGVLSVLERYGLHPGLVAGCSAGALIGAYYAYGYSTKEMMHFMREQKTSTLFSFRFDGLGLLSTEEFRTYLLEHLGDVTFAELKLPFCVVCTDLEAGREVVLREGSVVEALLATSAMPGIFAPVEMDGRLLADGGLCNNVPVSALVHEGARHTIGVQLLRNARGLEAPSLRKPKVGADGEGRVNLALWAERLRRPFRRPEHGHLPNGFDVLNRTLEIVLSQLEGQRLQAYPPDVLITPRTAHIATLSLSEEKEDIFQCGVDAAEDQHAQLSRIATALAPVG